MPQKRNADTAERFLDRDRGLTVLARGLGKAARMVMRKDGKSGAGIDGALGDLPA